MAEGDVPMIRVGDLTVSRMEDAVVTDQAVRDLAGRPVQARAVGQTPQPRDV